MAASSGENPDKNIGIPPIINKESIVFIYALFYHNRDELI